ncbi:glucosaminidase domain-containing protein [Amedibacillus sp. YH-ame10]
MKLKNTEKTTNRQKILFLSLATILLIVAILGIEKIRPIPQYTIYRLQSNGQKEKVKDIKSLNVAKKEMYKYADPDKQINAVIENDQGERVSIAYGIATFSKSEKTNIKYYDEHLDKMQTLDTQNSNDALYQDTRSVNGKLQVQFQLSTSVGLIELKDVELLNIFNEKEVSSFTKYIVKDGNLYHRVVNDIHKINSAEEIFLGKAPTKFKNDVYYSWDGAYFYTDFESLIKDKVQLKKSKKKFVSYTLPYIYQDIQQDTNYSIDELNEYISLNLDKDSKLQNSADLFFQAQDKFHINAITLFSIACFESDYGMNEYTQKNNALYTTQSKEKFNSISESINKFAKEILNDKYLNKTSPLYNGDFLGTKAEGIQYAYSNDVYWGEKITSIYASLDQSLGLKDKSLKKSSLKE